MESIELIEIANEIKYAQDNNIQIQTISSRFPYFSKSDAYFVSELIHRLRLEEGYIPIGRKIGFTNIIMWPILGIDEPIYSYVYNRTVTYISDEIDVGYISNLCEPRIEPEVVFHLSKTPKVNCDINDLLSCIDWISLGFEIVQSHYKNWEFKTVDTIVDAGLHRKLFIKEPIFFTPFNKNIIEELKTFDVSLFCNSKKIDKGFGSNVLGNPLNSILYLIDFLHKHNNSQMGLKAGEIISTGTLTKVLPIKDNETWSTQINAISLPDISVCFKS